MRTMLLTILGVAVFQFSIPAQMPNPYATVARRNVFGLKAPATAVVTESPAPVVPVKVFGVAEVFGYRQVIVRIGTNDCILHEGDTRDGVEIVKIQTGGTVEMRNQGVKQVIANFGAAEANK